jgi:glycogen synthase
MRLLITADPIGGVWDYTSTLVSALAGEGHSVLVAVLGHPAEEQLAQLPEEVTLECTAEVLEWMPNSAGTLRRTAERLSNLADRWRADAVHLNQMAYTGLTTFRPPTLVVVHSDVYSWFSEVRGDAPPAEWREYGQLIASGLAGATILAAPSRYQADLTERHFGRRPDLVLHNGTASPAPAPAPAAPDEMLVVTAGRAWDEAKGVSVLDCAVQLLGDTGPATHLFGPLESPEGESLDFRHLHCHGRRSSPEVHEWMSRASIYAAPSLYEPFGLAPLEAAHRGCALLLSDIGSFRELWDGTALFFRKGDAEHLAERITELLEDPARVRELATAAREHARGRFSAEAFAQRYQDLYHSLARRPSVHGRGSPSLAATEA